MRTRILLSQVNRLLVVVFGLLAWGCGVPDALADAVLPAEHDIDPAAQSAADKQIAVVEPRPFTKEGRGEIALGLGTIASDVFLVYLPVTLRGGYHFKEWISLEASASFMGCYGNAVGDNLERAAEQRCHRVLKSSYRQLTQQNLDLTHVGHVIMREYQVARFNVNPVWSPFVGKFALINDVIVHFDFNLSVGLGAVLVELMSQEHWGKSQIKASFEGNLGAGFRFVFQNLIGVRLDFREYLYGKQEKRGLATSSEFSLSLSLLL